MKTRPFPDPNFISFLPYPLNTIDTQMKDINLLKQKVATLETEINLLRRQMAARVKIGNEVIEI